VPWPIGHPATDSTSSDACGYATDAVCGKAGDPDPNTLHLHGSGGCPAKNSYGTESVLARSPLE